jgi:hypothetical protein
MHLDSIVGAIGSRTLRGAAAMAAADVIIDA